MIPVINLCICCSLMVHWRSIIKSDIMKKFFLILSQLFQKYSAWGKRPYASLLLVILVVLSDAFLSPLEDSVQWATSDCSSGGRAGCILIRRFVVWSLAPSVCMSKCMLKCLWARYWIPNCPKRLCLWRMNAYAWVPDGTLYPAVSVWLFVWMGECLFMFKKHLE